MLVAGNDLESKVNAFMTSSNLAGTEVKTSKLLNGGIKLQYDPGTGGEPVAMSLVARFSFDWHAINAFITKY